MRERPYPEGIDCVWLASDCNGHLGAFVTGGVGPIPTRLLADKDNHVEDIEAIACNLPEVSESRMLVSVKRPDDFMELGARGIYVYDWSDIHRTISERRHTYEPVTVPLNPITVGMLPDNLAQMARLLMFSGLAFVDNKPLDVCMHMNCQEGRQSK